MPQVNTSVQDLPYILQDLLGFLTYTWVHLASSLLSLSLQKPADQSLTLNSISYLHGDASLILMVKNSKQAACLLHTEMYFRHNCLAIGSTKQYLSRHAPWA